MQAILDRQGLPAAYVRALGPQACRALSGAATTGPAWFYRGGGWLSPAALARQWLGAGGVRFCGGVAVQRAEATSAGWRLLDAGGRVLAEAPVLVLANAADLPRLLGAPPWPLSLARGQVSWWPRAPAGLRAPALPLAGNGYALALPGGGLLCGASVAEDDEEPALRDADHAHNLQRLSLLTGQPLPAGLPSPEGRVGWRVQTPDRLPLVGAVPLAPEEIKAGSRLDQARMLPRRQGLFVLGALGSRGIGWAPLAAQLLAAWIDGAPLPLESDLLDAIDPARFQVRNARRTP